MKEGRLEGMMIDKRDLSKCRIKKGSRAQDIIPIKKICESGMRRLDDGRYAITYELKDIDFASQGDDEKETIFESYSKLLNSLGGGSSYKITICNRRVNKKTKLEKSLISSNVGDGYDNLRLAYNRLRYDDVAGNKAYIKSKYITISTYQSRENKAETSIARNAGDIHKKLLMIDSGLRQLQAEEYGELVYDFLRTGHESEYNYSFGIGNIRDYISPDAIKIHASYFETGEKYGRGMMLKTLGPSINDDFLKEFSEIKATYFISQDIITMSKAEARRLIERKDDDVEANADAWSNKRKIREGSAIRIPRRVKSDRKIIDEYIEDMDENNQKVFLVQLTMVFIADTMEELNDITESVYDTAEGSSSQMCICYGQQLEALQTAIPFGVRRINNLRDCNTDTTAGMMIFDQVQIDHSTGIPFGRHEGTNQQVMVDLTKLINGHTWVFGKSGSGKSMNVKVKSIYEAMLTDGDIIWVDVDGECGKLMKAIGGQTVHVGIDSINVADIVPDWGDSDNPIDPVKDGINNITNFIQRTLEDNLGDVEKSLIDRSMRMLYKAVLDGDEPYVTLRDLYDVLSLAKETEANKLALALERFIVGSFDCFAKPTSVDINSRIMCYDLSTLDKQLRNIGMDIVLDHIQRRLINNRKLGRATYIYLEEMDYHLTHHDTLMRLREFYERARKYGGFITGIIQNATRVLQVPEAHTMLLNAEVVIMHKQDRDDAYELARMYGLSSVQLKSLQYAEPGHGINKIGDIKYAFDCTIPKDNELYLITNTDLKGE